MPFNFGARRRDRKAPSEPVAQHSKERTEGGEISDAQVDKFLNIQKGRTPPTGSIIATKTPTQSHTDRARTPHDPLKEQPFLLKLISSLTVNRALQVLHPTVAVAAFLKFAEKDYLVGEYVQKVPEILRHSLGNYGWGALGVSGISMAIFMLTDKLKNQFAIAAFTTAAYLTAGETVLPQILPGHSGLGGLATGFAAILTAYCIKKGSELRELPIVVDYDMLVSDKSRGIKGRNVIFEADLKFLFEADVQRTALRPPLIMTIGNSTTFIPQPPIHYMSHEFNYRVTLSDDKGQPRVAYESVPLLQRAEDGKHVIQAQFLGLNKKGTPQFADMYLYTAP